MKRLSYSDILGALYTSGLAFTKFGKRCIPMLFVSAPAVKSTCPNMIYFLVRNTSMLPALQEMLETHLCPVNPSLLTFL